MFITESFIRLGRCGFLEDREEMGQQPYVDRYIDPPNHASRPEMCCTLQGYSPQFVIVLTSIQTAHYYSGVHDSFVERGSVRRHVRTCLLLRVCYLRLCA